MRDSSSGIASDCVRFSAYAAASTSCGNGAMLFRVTPTQSTRCCVDTPMRLIRQPTKVLRQCSGRMFNRRRTSSMSSTSERNGIRCTSCRIRTSISRGVGRTAKRSASLARCSTRHCRSWTKTPITRSCKTSHRCTNRMRKALPKRRFANVSPKAVGIFRDQRTANRKVS